MSTWEELRQECLNCRKCGLCQTRTNVVFGVGKEDAEVMFIGEGPGQQEDLKGEPFVGRSGQLLDKLMATVDLFRDRNIYIANTVKCRPPQNRDPPARGAGGVLRMARQPDSPDAPEDNRLRRQDIRPEIYLEGLSRHKRARTFL